jgi:hypothetical protein
MSVLNFRDFNYVKGTKEGRLEWLLFLAEVSILQS